MDQPAPITQILERVKTGDQEALSALIPLVYSELRRMAGSYLRGERPDHTLQPTALVHEAYMRMAAQDHPDYQSRAHFFGVASQIMRQVLVDSSRRRKAAKRSEPKTVIDSLSGPLTGFDLISAVDDALKTLEKQDALRARLIEMRFFGGLTAEESAAVLNLPVQTVRSQLRVAQAWLKRELDREHAAKPA